MRKIVKEETVEGYTERDMQLSLTKRQKMKS